MANFRHAVIVSVAFLFSSVACAQDAISAIARNTTTTKTVFAVFDVRPASASPIAVQEAIASAFRVHYDGIKLNQAIAPYPLPTIPLRMTFSQQTTSVGTISEPNCPGATSIVSATDTTMLKQGEVSILKACVFPYRDGLRVNLFATFGQKSGGGDPNILGAMLGRLITNAVGLGDSSKFIDTTIDDIEQRLSSISPSVALVELQPAREGKVVVADPANNNVADAHAIPSAITPGQAQPSSPVPISPSAARLPVGAPEELAKAQLAVQQMFQQQRQLLADARLSQEATNSPSNALSARKELNAMGLTYYNQVNRPVFGGGSNS